MQATTIKLDGKLLTDLKHILPPDQSLTGFVRELILRELRARKMRRAAAEYTQFLKQNAPAAREQDEWENANLASEPRSRPSKGKS